MPTTLVPKVDACGLSYAPPRRECPSPALIALACSGSAGVVLIVLACIGHCLPPQRVMLLLLGSAGLAVFGTISAVFALARARRRWALAVASLIPSVAVALCGPPIMMNIRDDALNQRMRLVELRVRMDILAEAIEEYRAMHAKAYPADLTEALREADVLPSIAQLPGSPRPLPACYVAPTGRGSAGQIIASTFSEDLPGRRVVLFGDVGVEIVSAGEFDRMLAEPINSAFAAALAAAE